MWKAERRLQTRGDKLTAGFAVGCLALGVVLRFCGDVVDQDELPSQLPLSTLADAHNTTGIDAGTDGELDPGQTCAALPALVPVESDEGRGYRVEPSGCATPLYAESGAHPVIDSVDSRSLLRDAGCTVTGGMLRVHLAAMDGAPARSGLVPYDAGTFEHIDQPGHCTPPAHK